jgi:hypothetical protein
MEELDAQLRRQSAIDRIAASTQLTTRQLERMQLAYVDQLDAISREQRLSSSITTTVERVLRDMTHREDELRRAIGPVDYARYVSEIVRGAQIGAMLQRDPLALLSTADAFGATMARLEREAMEWGDRLRAMEGLGRELPLLRQQIVQTSIATYATSVQRAMALAHRFDLPDRSPAVAGHLLAPAEAFVQYAPAAIERSAQGDDPEARAVATASLTLAESQVLATADEQDDWSSHVDDMALGLTDEEEDAGVITMPPTPERHTSGSAYLIVPMEGAERILRFFGHQEADVRAHAALLVDLDGAPLTQVVPTARRAAQQQEFCRLLVACNREVRARHPGRDVPFPMGETILAFSTEMGLIDGGAPDGLNALIDGLNVTLYEATAKRRRLRPYLAEADCVVVDRVAHLRNLTRHNRETSPPVGIEQDARQLLAHLKAMGLDGEPVTREERLVLHDRLLADAITLLETLLAAVRRS